MQRNKILVLTGPTASGKSQLAISLASHFCGAIVNADSRTIYQEMDIGTAKPFFTGSKDLEIRSRRYTVKLCDEIEHYLIDFLLPNQVYSVADYQKDAKEVVQYLWQQSKLPILVGGTGLYIDALVKDYDFSEAGTDHKLRIMLEKQSLTELVKKLLVSDPQTASAIDLKNKRRVVRALEVFLSTGKSISNQTKRDQSDWDVLKIGIDFPRELIYERINARVDKMINSGLVEEAQDLVKRYGSQAPGFSGIGYAQISSYLSGEFDLKEAVRLIKRDTRRYAKRQLTWFRRDPEILWLAPDQILPQVNKWLNQAV
ncbi:MAG TPA: tRNA (adenosine(37)-N6)-dimethylallyltransferase MiaA [Candidatus Wirthbacteria bacterium]|nr:tRNA (adenosine(37)-N6)-dimethylallyltransferase MiaA [Candidatus Wirthbacteria bacterium]